MIKKLFISAATIGLAVNLYSDFEVLQQSKAAVASGQWVEHGYNVLRQVDGIKILVLESQIRGTANEQLHREIQSLGSMLEDTPSQRELSEKLNNLSDRDLAATKFNPALQILSEIGAVEKALLNVRLGNDTQENSQALAKALFASGLDTFLILLFLSFFLYERRSSLKVHKKLLGTLAHVESNAQKLHRELAQKTTQLKTTVHDLKNPLGSIRGFAELIFDDSGGKSGISEMASMIQRVSNDSLALVSSLLRDGNDEAAPKERVDISECLKETCFFLEPIAKDKGQRIKIEINSGESTFKGHKHQIQDVFFNIIGNALKFSPKGSPVSVHCRTRDGFLEVQVKDSGPGFTSDDFPKLFGKSTTLSAKPTGSEVSTGLGLFSAKRTMDEIGGTIKVANQAAGGACVTIRFPMQYLSTAGQSPIPKEAIALH